MSTADKKSYFQNASLYVGNDADVASNNTPCQESPFLDINNSNNYFIDDAAENNNDVKPWKFGEEIWCN